MAQLRRRAPMALKLASSRLYLSVHLLLFRACKGACLLANSTKKAGTCTRNRTSCSRLIPRAAAVASTEATAARLRCLRGQSLVRTNTTGSAGVCVVAHLLTRCCSCCQTSRLACAKSSSVCRRGQGGCCLPWPHSRLRLASMLGPARALRSGDWSASDPPLLSVPVDSQSQPTVNGHQW